MRLSEFRTFLCLTVVGGCLLLTADQLKAQDLLPAVQWNVEGTGNWTDDGNWVLSGSDPAVDGVPGVGDIASFQNGGTGVISVALPEGCVGLIVNNGTMQLDTGGALTVGGQALFGANGTLALNGGSLTSDSLTFAGGTIDLSASADLSLGTVIPVATASSVGGNPDHVTVGGDAPSLDLGVGITFGGTDTGAALTVRTVPVLQIDRVTGATSIISPAGDVDLKGYSLTSRQGNLIGGDRWNSLAGQGTEGWNDDVNNTDPTTRITEYNLASSTTINGGGNLGIGTPYNGLGDNFLSPAQEDFEVQFFLGDDTVLDGVVNYLGAPNDLVLTIDPMTGSATVGNTSTAIAPNVTSYTVLSASGSLIPDNFSGIGGDDWTNANPQDIALADLNLEGSQLFDTDTIIPIGDIFNAETGTQDLVLQYSLVSGEVRTGTVFYGEPTVPDDCLTVAASRAIQGDLDGNNTVDFSDFLVLSTNFNTAQTRYEDGDITCDGTVAFADFLILSTNFNQSVPAATGAEAASVPEPAAGLLAFIGILGMLKFRNRGPKIVGALAAVCLCGTMLTQQTYAVDFDTRFIRMHPDGPDNAINSVTEARNILNGTDIDGFKNEDLTGKLTVIDLAGGLGDFAEDTPYLNGVNDETMDNFLQYVSGVVNIPEGQWSIGCGSDDGCIVNMPGVTFTETFNENGPTVDGDGEIIFNPGRGHDWTFGNFTVGAGGITTGFEALFNEGGGGDSMELGISDIQIDPDIDPVDNTDNRRATAGALFAILTDGELGWEITGDPFIPNSIADLDRNGVVNLDDEALLRGNFGGSGVGDLNADDIVDFEDLAVFIPILEASAPGAQSVPEPAGLSLVLLGVAALLGLRRRR